MLKYLFGFLIFISLTSCDKWAEVEATGLVRDAATQQPLDSVYVTLYEDNEGSFMGNHLLQETTTDGSGTFKFNFDYKEGPYKIFVSRPRYRYSRTETDKILGLSATFEYQELAPLKNEQSFTFDMNEQVNFIIKLKNTPPALPTDQIKIEAGTTTATRPALTWEFDGPVALDLEGGFVDANKFLPVKYSVRENNNWRNVMDSIYVQPGKTAVYNLQY